MTSSISINTESALAASAAARSGARAGTGTPSTGTPDTTTPSTGTPNARGTRGSGNDAVQLSFSGIVRSERIKLSSLRSIRLALTLTVLFGLAMSALLAFILADNAPSGGSMSALDLQNHLLMTATFPAPFLALVFGVIGVFAISSEYSSGMILSTLAAVPRRTPVFLAKGLVLALVTGLSALVLVAGGLVLAMVTLPESAAQLGSLPVISGALGTVAFLLLISLFAFGVAGILRSTAGGIAVVAGVTFVLPVALQVLSLSGWAWLNTAMNYTPTMLSSTLSQGLSTVVPNAAAGFWQALAAMVVWAAVTVVPAAILFTKRDAK